MPAKTYTLLLMPFHLLDAPRFRSADISLLILDRLPHIAPSVRLEFRAFVAGGIAADLVRDDIAVSDGAILAALRKYEVRWPSAFSRRPTPFDKRGLV